MMHLESFAGCNRSKIATPKHVRCNKSNIQQLFFQKKVNERCAQFSSQLENRLNKPKTYRHLYVLFIICLQISLGIFLI